MFQFLYGAKNKRVCRSQKKKKKSKNSYYSVFFLHTLNKRFLFVSMEFSTVLWKVFEIFQTYCIRVVYFSIYIQTITHRRRYIAEPLQQMYAVFLFVFRVRYNSIQLLYWISFVTSYNTRTIFDVLFIIIVIIPVRTTMICRFLELYYFSTDPTVVCSIAMTGASLYTYNGVTVCAYTSFVYVL